MDGNITIVLDSRVLPGVCGANDGNLRVLEGFLDGRIAVRGNELRFQGSGEPAVRRFKLMIEHLAQAVREGEEPSPDYVRALADAVPGETDAGEAGFALRDGASGIPRPVRDQAAGFGEDGGSATDPVRENLIHIPHGFRTVFPRGKNQAAYIQGMRKADITFCVGPAGTGKTFLAIAEALHLVLTHKIRRLVLTRPVVEAGESLGFLPGDLSQKIHPYLRPLYDAMEALVPFETVRRMEEDHTIEIAPLAYMRGRSLSGSVVILDEAQNTTREQMKMFLTRIGEGSKAVITGDITQIDLPRHIGSGLVHALSVLETVSEIHIAWLHSADVVRHPLIRKIIQAYDEAESGEKSAGLS